MASLKTRDIINNLGKKGFDVNNTRDHIWLNYLTPEGRKTMIRTKLSHGEDSIGDPLISAMAKQTQLRKNEFINLVSCSMSREEYYSIVKDKC